MHSLLKSYLEKNYRRNKKVKGYLNLVSLKQAAVFLFPEDFLFPAS